MELRELTPDQEALVEQACRLIERRTDPVRHQVACVLRTADGQVHWGINLRTDLGRARVCAEAVALGHARAEGSSPVDFLAAVFLPANGDGGRARVVSPCGACREMLADFCADAAVAVVTDHGPRLARADQLLPSRFSKD